MFRELTQEQKMVVELSREVGERFGLEYWLEKDQAKETAFEMWSAICEVGLGGLILPTEVGGGGGTVVDLSLAIEELAAGGGGSTVGQLFMNNTIFGMLGIGSYGTPELREEMLGPLLKGSMWTCMALTEPDAGSNTLEITTRAVRDGDGWRLSGQKIWITGVTAAQKMLVIARTRTKDEVQRRTDGISMFMVDVDRAGLSHTLIEKLGTRTLSASMVYFDNVRVEPHELVGTEHGGWPELLDILNTERMVTAAGVVGAGRLAIRMAVEFAKGRKVFGDRTISSYQGLQFPLASAHAQLHAARLVNLQASHQYDIGEESGETANIGKYLAVRAAENALDSSMQTMGGMGYAVESHLERLWRDARLFRFAPVSEEMILNYLAVHTLGMDRGY
jgi:acyl-CoA dehydrogenase